MRTIPSQYSKPVKALKEILHGLFEPESKLPFEVEVYLWHPKATKRVGPRISEISTVVRTETSVGGTSLMRADYDCAGVILAAEDVLLNLILNRRLRGQAKIDGEDELQRAIEKLKYLLNH